MGVIGATMVRGERGGDAGGVVDIVDIEGRDAERGLQESLRRQLKGCILVYSSKYHAGPMSPPRLGTGRDPRPLNIDQLPHTFRYSIG